MQLRIEVLLKAKSAELDILKQEASHDACSERINKCISDTFDMSVEMDFQGEFRKEVWEAEIQKFVDAGHEHLLFGKAAASSRNKAHISHAQQNKEKAKQCFENLPKVLLDLMVEAKVLNMTKGRCKGNSLMQRILLKQILPISVMPDNSLPKEHGRHMGLRRDGGFNGAASRSVNPRSQSRGRDVNTKPQTPRSSSHKSAKGKGKGKGKRGFSRARSRSLSKGKGKREGKSKSKGG